MLLRTRPQAHALPFFVWTITPILLLQPCTKSVGQVSYVRTRLFLAGYVAHEIRVTGLAYIVSNVGPWVLRQAYSSSGEEPQKNARPRLDPLPDRPLHKS